MATFRFVHKSGAIHNVEAMSNTLALHAFADTHGNAYLRECEYGEYGSACASVGDVAFARLSRAQQALTLAQAELQAAMHDVRDVVLSPADLDHAQLQMLLHLTDR